MYIVTQLLSKKEKDELQQTFAALDKNADGKLSREELIEGYTTIYGNKEQAEKEVQAIMEKADVDHSGYIDYSGTSFPHLCARVLDSLHQQKEGSLQEQPQESFPALRQGTLSPQL